MHKIKLMIEIDEEDFKSIEYSTLLYHLHATPITESDDCVSREAVLKINENHHGEMPNHINFEIWNEIKALPSVTPKREQGEYDEDCKTLQIKLENAEVTIENLKEDLRQAREDLRYVEMR